MALILKTDEERMAYMENSMRSLISFLQEVGINSPEDLREGWSEHAVAYVLWQMHEAELIDDKQADEIIEAFYNKLCAILEKLKGQHREH